MSEVLLVLGGVGLALVLGGAGIVLLSRRDMPVPPSASIRATVPTSAQRRQARDVAISHGVRLASMLARVDGEVHGTELEAIHEFITTHVKKADVPFAARIMRTGLDGPTEVSREESLARIQAVADAEQRQLVFELLVFVAQADGHIHEAERAFLEEVAPSLGVARAALAARLDAWEKATRAAGVSPE